ncbi:hypothetical protein J4470_04570 [Candidatus Woesearchaeota archaeon]|nr:hypothetical protein [Candidatus Woesearchaeota archaeon]
MAIQTLTTPSSPIDELPVYQYQDLFTWRLGQGCNNNVFALNRHHVARVKKPLQWSPDSEEERLRRTKKAYDVVVDAYESGIPVPEPVGVFQVRIVYERNLFGLFYRVKPAVVVKRVRGIRGDRAKGDLAGRVSELHENLKNIVRNKGFLWGDDWLRNTMYNPREGVLFLTDFDDLSRVFYHWSLDITG